MLNKSISLLIMFRDYIIIKLVPNPSSPRCFLQMKNIVKNGECSSLSISITLKFISDETMRIFSLFKERNNWVYKAEHFSLTNAQLADEDPRGFLDEAYKGQLMRSECDSPHLCWSFIGDEILLIKLGPDRMSLVSAKT